MPVGYPKFHRGLPISDGIVGAWSFREGSGSKIYDQSGRENHATLQGTSAWANGRLGNCVSFPGSSGNNAICAAGSIAASHDFSVVIYCSPASTSTDSAFIVSQGSSTGTDKVIQCGMHFANPQFNFWSDDWQPSGVNMSAGLWYWLIYTFITSSKTRAIYVNGTAIGTNTATGNPVGGGVLKFGGDATLFSGSPWNGKIAEVRVYERTLSAVEAAQISAGCG